MREDEVDEEVSYSESSVEELEFEEVDESPALSLLSDDEVGLVRPPLLLPPRDELLLLLLLLLLLSLPSSSLPPLLLLLLPPLLLLLSSLPSPLSLPPKIPGTRRLPSDAISLPAASLFSTKSRISIAAEGRSFASAYSRRISWR